MIDIPDSIFPKDNDGNLLCPKCLKQVSACSCPSGEPPKPKAKKLQPKVQLDKSGRRGKVVTIIRNLPRDERGLSNLAKELKVKTGSGGTFYTGEDGGVIELQGDHKRVIDQFFK